MFPLFISHSHIAVKLNSYLFYNALDAINYCPVEYVEQSVSSV